MLRIHHSVQPVLIWARKGLYNFATLLTQLFYLWPVVTFRGSLPCIISKMFATFHNLSFFQLMIMLLMMKMMIMIHYWPSQISGSRSQSYCIRVLNASLPAWGKWYLKLFQGSARVSYHHHTIVCIEKRVVFVVDGISHRKECKLHLWEQSGILFYLHFHFKFHPNPNPNGKISQLSKLGFEIEPLEFYVICHAHNIVQH